MDINKIYNENCLDTMSRMKDNFIDLTVTSPPYDNLRTYKGFDFDWKATIKELYRVTKEGGVVVWVEGDATVKGSETGTSFKQALFFKECGFNLHDTMIWSKPNAMPTQSTRYQQGFEFMFVFTKGKLKAFNPIKIESKCKGFKVKKHRAKTDGHNYNEEGYYTVSTEKMIDNVWSIANTKNKTKHKAIFPKQLANDHIISWSNEGDLVYDPFMGSGTTMVASHEVGREAYGMELDPKYCQVIIDRMQKLDSSIQVKINGKEYKALL